MRDRLSETTMAINGSGMNGALLTGGGGGGDDARAAEIDQLRGALDNAIAYRERMRQPPTSKEIAIRAMDRLWRGNHAYGLFILVLVAMTIVLIWFPWSNFPIFLTPLLVIGPLFLVAYAHERTYGEQSRRAWRDRQIAETDADIEEIRAKLFALGATELDRNEPDTRPPIAH